MVTVVFCSVFVLDCVGAVVVAFLCVGHCYAGWQASESTMDKVPSNRTFTSKCKSLLTKMCLFLQNRGGGVVVMLKGFRLMDMDEGQHHTVTVALSHSPSPSGFTCASKPHA